MDEIWMDIKGYEGLYQVSNLGKVRSLDRFNSLGRKIKGQIMTTIYNKKRNNTSGKVLLSKDGVKRCYYVNRLVWLTFNNKELDDKIFVYHNIENTNNNMNNLKISNSKKEIGIKKIANKYSHSVKCVTENKVFKSVSEASRYYNINRRDIYTCCKGKQYTGGKLSDGTPLVWEYYK